MANPSSIDVETLQRRWEAAGQGQVLRFLPNLDPSESAALLKQLSVLEPEYVNEMYRLFGAETQVAKIKETQPIQTIKGTKEELKAWRQLGLRALSEGKAVVLLMAGGQGTRLGSAKPKGMYNVGLPSGKSLFQLQAERLVRLKDIIGQETGVKNAWVPWYIMTSSEVHEDTVKYFQENNYFGLPSNTVTFFKQEDFPTLSPDGKILLKAKNQIMQSPNGNGGVWRALVRDGIVADWEAKGVQWVATYSVDNVLVKMADPTFLGFCIDRKLEIGSKVVPKASPEERVGVLAIKDGKFGVLEYTEIDEKRRLMRTPHGDLVYSASHLVINTYSLDFIKRFTKEHLNVLPFHIAKKKQKVSGELVGSKEPQEIDVWKMELFAFDVFEFANKVVAFETTRAEEFSPLKNSLSVPTDNAQTCCQHVKALHMKWVEEAGGIITNKSSDFLCEISPLLTYEGEGLEEIVKGRTYTLPLHLQ